MFRNKLIEMWLLTSYRARRFRLCQEKWHHDFSDGAAPFSRANWAESDNPNSENSPAFQIHFWFLLQSSLDSYHDNTRLVQQISIYPSANTVQSKPAYTRYCTMSCACTSARHQCRSLLGQTICHSFCKCRTSYESTASAGCCPAYHFR